MASTSTTTTTTSSSSSSYRFRTQPPALGAGLGTSSGSSSAFTEAEILAELEQLGYTLSTEQIAELQKEINAQFLKEFSSASEPDAPQRSARPPYRPPINFANVDPEVAELLTEAYRVSDLVRNDTNRMEEALARNRSTQTMTKTKVLHPLNTGDTMSSIPLSDVEVDDLCAAYDKVKQQPDDPLLQPTIRPLVCPDAGGLPFKHDPVKRYELYSKEWQKFPIPGANKRLQLRWKVREYMLRQDMPVLVKKT